MRKRMLLIALSIVILLGGTLVIEPIVEVNAKELPHEKATAADVRNAANSNGALKGVQGTDFADVCGDNVGNLNMNAMFLNVDISKFVNTQGKGTYVGSGFGVDYYIDDQTPGSMYLVYKERVEQYREQGVTWNFCLVMGWSNDANVRKLMYNAKPGHTYYAWNTTDATARSVLAKIVDKMGEDFSYKDTFVQNWWINNEVNVLNDKIYSMDKLDESQLVNLAVTSYDMLYDSLRITNPNALAYVSVTHDWNNDNDGKGIPTRRFLDLFGAREKNRKWNVDLHAYPPQMHEQVWTKASSAYLRNDADTFTVCAPNLDVFTNYIKSNFGNNHRVIMSEQGFDSRYGEDNQAIMMAYTYFKAQANPMVDEVIFTAYYDTDSAGHDFYKMGIRGNRQSGYAFKQSYSVFKSLNTNSASSVCAPYFTKLCQKVGRQLNSWTDDILYKSPATSVRLNYANLYLPGASQSPGSIFIGMNSDPNNSLVDLEYRWDIFDYSTGTQTQVQGWKMNAEWLRYYPSHNGNYEVYCTVRVAGNPSSTVTAHVTLNYQGQVWGDVSSPIFYETNQGDTRTWPVTYDGYTFTKDGDGVVRCTDSRGRAVINQFKCDGIYTYYFQGDGTCMRDRLSYHPDGVHIIYFDSQGHEVFSNFANVKKSISNTPVDDFCFFDVYGFLYVDCLTYDQAGQRIYYANPYGVMEVNKWFQFSNNVKWADGASADANKNQYGYAQYDGTLLKDSWTFDWLGRWCYMQGNGAALY